MGQSIATLKLYSPEGSEADSWMTAVKQNAMGEESKLFHVIFTYDLSVDRQPQKLGARFSIRRSGRASGFQLPL